MGTLKKLSIVVASLGSFGAIGWGFYLALHSSLFQLSVIQVTHSPEGAHVGSLVFNDETILKLSQIRPGEVGLFEVDLPKVERHLLANEWIQEVRLKKVLPHTLAITVIYREPKAYLQNRKGKLTYVDSSGKSFGIVNLLTYRDLPFLQGFSQEQPGKIQEGIRWIEQWNKSVVSKFVQLSSLQWDSERGFRALVSYPFRDGVLQARAMVNFGDSTDSIQLQKQFENLGRVISYLSKNYIATRRISLEQSKKVVVKIPYAS